MCSGFGPRWRCRAEGAAPPSRTYISRCNGARGLFSRGGGAAAEQLTLEAVAKNISDRQHQRVVVMAGAGISTPSGIPDFRSPGSGLYDNLQEYHLPYAEAIFEIGFFHQNPKPFFALAKELYPGKYQPNVTHYFVRLLQQKGQLLRMYTQNIDGLERRTYLSLKSLHIVDIVLPHTTIPTSTACLNSTAHPTGTSRPTSTASPPTLPSPPAPPAPPAPPVRPTIPTHPTSTSCPIITARPTSTAHVEPFSSLAGAIRSSVPRLLINRELVGPFAWSRRPHDAVQLGDVVVGVQVLVDALGWTRELDALMAAAADKATIKTEE
ncbi:putative NAD-dependent protein deacetylase sirtuin-3 mitochondrial [Scophthalmus maximus]|uniref:Putative NAD-dependent protein deacetylase sirtuin-3 mitochondrial n=1 Tax=Scophthalmus maximus TaxID=52904 RepID=A0A2U9BAZ5_SCOMX|nr:putative NAD-dependent protein deacetylase sirtuin-3 mitochondrial [Scophthalmus maximus]